MPCPHDQPVQPIHSPNVAVRALIAFGQGNQTVIPSGAARVFFFTTAERWLRGAERNLHFKPISSRYPTRTSFLPFKSMLD